MSGSLRDKTVRSVGWSAVDNVFRVGISFVVSVVLARLLGPEEYGLIGILTIFINVFNSIVDSGFTNALIRKQDADRADYSTAFVTNLVLSVTLSCVLFLCAGPIAHFFGRPQLVALTRVMSVIVVINALALVQKVRLTKALDFRTQTKVTVIASTASGIVGIGMALAGCGVWSLVGQQISCQLLNTVCLWAFNRWVPSLRFSRESFRGLWSFGWKLMVSGLIDTTWKEIYQVVIGRFYSPQALGHYTRAKQFASLCSTNLTTVVQRVSYPVLSSIQDDIPRLREAYRKVIRTTMLPTFCLMLGMAACAEPMILVLIGEKWLPCVPMLRIVCLSMMLYPLHAINLNMLQVQGRSDLFLKLEILKKAIAVGPLLLGIFMNIYWMLAGSVVTGCISFWLNARCSGPFLGYGVLNQVRDILPSFGIAVAMAVAVYAVGLIPMSPFLTLPLQILVGVVIAVALCEAAGLPEYGEIKSIALSGARHLIHRG